MVEIARDALGLGLRIPHYPYLFEHYPAVDYFEIITENFLTDAEPPRRHLDLVRGRYPLVLHGISLNLLGDQPPDPGYLDRVAELAEEVDAPFVTDHLCWTGSHGLSHHDLLPAPYVEDLVEVAASRAAAVQRHLGRPFGIENLSSYVSFRRSTMSEWEFYTSVVREAGCYYMLDINNVYVSSQNHSFDPNEYLRAIDYNRVLQVHLAGHSRQPNGMIVDTHDQPVSEAVWELYRSAWDLGGPFPTLLEWDDHIPEMPTVLEELEKAKRFRSPRWRRETLSEMERPAPDWLIQLQQAFGATLRTPLVVSRGALRAELDAYPQELCEGCLPGPNTSERERLAVYNRQYWFRLFQVMHQAFPLVTRLLGHFRMNQISSAYLCELPPTTRSIDDIGERFCSYFLERCVSQLEPPQSPRARALVEAAELDDAWRRCFAAPPVEALRLGPSDLPLLAERRLQKSSHAALLRFTFPLLELRAQVCGDDSEAPIPIPSPLAEPIHVLLLRSPAGMAHRKLEKGEWTLLSLLQEAPLPYALAQLETVVPEEDRAALPGKVQLWLARSMQLGIWRRLLEEDA